jgi:hypothetical protein
MHFIGTESTAFVCQLFPLRYIFIISETHYSFEIFQKRSNTFDNILGQAGSKIRHERGASMCRFGFGGEGGTSSTQNLSEALFSPKLDSARMRSSNEMFGFRADLSNFVSPS